MKEKILVIKTGSSDFYYKIFQIFIFKQFLEIVALAYRLFNMSEASAPLECIMSYLRYRVRNRKARQARAPSEFRSI